MNKKIKRYSILIFILLTIPMGLFELIKNRFREKTANRTTTIVKNIDKSHLYFIHFRFGDFKQFNDFKDAAKRGGIGIMEIVSAYLKSKGQYNSRTLSYEGIITNSLFMHL